MPQTAALPVPAPRSSMMHETSRSATSALSIFTASRPHFHGNSMTVQVGRTSGASIPNRSMLRPAISMVSPSMTVATPVTVSRIEVCHRIRSCDGAMATASDGAPA